MAGNETTERTDETSHSRTRLRRTGVICLIAALVIGLAAIVYPTAGAAIMAPPGMLPEVEEQPAPAEMRVVPESEVKHHPEEIRIRTYAKDWLPFRNAVRNDVHRHGGWFDYSPQGTEYHVPADYINRLQPLIDTSDERPHNSAYVAWTTMTLQEPRERNDKAGPADTVVTIIHDIPVSDHVWGRRAFEAMIGLFAAALLAAMVLTALTEQT